MTDITLHQWEISPFCQKVARALRFKGLAYRTEDYNGLLGTQVMRLSKVGKVPVLDIDGQRLQDSTCIVRYLDERFPEPPLFPRDPQQRALAELWEDWADESLYWFEVYFRVKDPQAFDQVAELASAGRPLLERLPTKLTVRAMLGLQLYSQGLGRQPREAVEAEFLRHLDRIETVLARGDWLVGEHQTIADIAVGSQLLEVLRTSDRLRPELLRRSRLAAWLERI